MDGTETDAAMARIRTIKPEFPHSESMGRVSRDARLTFILMWPLADDSGRLRGNSRMLASLLFPYDDDAKDLIDRWLGELEREQCILRYQVEGTSYVQILNWLKHQKIDHPSPSRLPSPDEGSRGLANPREGSCLDQGLEGNGSGSAPQAAPAAISEEKPKRRGKAQSQLVQLPGDFSLTDSMRQQALKRHPDCDVESWFEAFCAHHRAHGKAMKDWSAAWVTWVGNGIRFGYPRRKEATRATNGLPILNG